MRYITISSALDGTLALHTDGAMATHTSHQLLIKVKAAGINRADLLQAEGKYPPPDGVNAHVPGLEVAGEIVEIGAQVQGAWKQGQKVCALLPGAGYAEYVAIEPACVLPVPTGISMEEAAALPEALYTAWMALMVKAQMQPKEKVLIHCAASGVGIMALQLVSIMGGVPVATARTARKRDIIRQYVGEYIFDYTHENWQQECEANIGKMDIVLDILAGEYVAQNIKALGVNGRYIALALMKGGTANIHMASIIMKNITIHGMTLRSQPFHVKQIIGDALQKHVWPALEARTITPVIERILPIEDVQHAHSIMRAGDHIGKLVLTFD